MIRADRPGDVMTASGIPGFLKASDPDVFVGMLVSSKTAVLLDGNPWVNLVLCDDGRSPLSMAKLIRPHAFDSAFLLHPSRRLAWAVRFSGIPRRFGVGGKVYDWLCGIRGLARASRMIRHQSGLDILALGGHAGGDAPPALYLASAEKATARRRKVQAMQGRPKGLVGLQVSHAGGAQNWRPSRWVELAVALDNEGFGVLVHDWGLEAEASTGIRKALQDKGPVFLPRADLRDLAVWIAACDLFVGPSTGPLHMAAGLGVPCLGLCCPLPAFGKESWLLSGETPVFSEGEPCEKCPGTKDCQLEGISVERVVDRVREMLPPDRQA